MEAVARNERSRIVRAAKEKVASIEKEIVAAEHRLDEIDARLADQATYQTEGLARTLGDERKSIQVDLSRLNRRWEEMASRLAEVEEEPGPSS